MQVGYGEGCRYYQRNAPWGLVRSSLRDYTTSNECYFYSYGIYLILCKDPIYNNIKCSFIAEARGVNVYVIDR